MYKTSVGLRGIFHSKKALLGIFGTALSFIAYSNGVPVSEIKWLLSPLLTAIAGQGIADIGKEKAQWGFAGGLLNSETLEPVSDFKPTVKVDPKESTKAVEVSRDKRTVRVPTVLWLTLPALFMMFACKSSPLITRVSSDGAVEMGTDLNNFVIVAEGKGQINVLSGETRLPVYTFTFGEHSVTIQRLTDPKYSESFSLGTPLPLITKSWIESVFSSTEIEAIGLTFEQEQTDQTE